MIKDKIICWWSGGITSAVACKKAIEIYGKDNCRVIMLDTKNEHEDTYRFLKDCEKWYGLSIEILTSKEVDNIEETWLKYNSLNTANGAICSYMLKRKVREEFEKNNKFSHQVFGFEFDRKEFNRAMSMTLNNPKVKAIYPLLLLGLDKNDCVQIVKEAGIKIPEAYRLGFNNNNCLGSKFGGCTQGGIGYWQKIKKDFPDLFEKRAKLEHTLTDRKGKPVTMLKDQSKEAKDLVKSTGNKYANLVFLKPHPNYPDNKCIDDMKGRPPKPLNDCNGFCGINDLSNKNNTEEEINWEEV